MAGLISFASDNHAGVHSAVLEAIAAANVGYATAYGDDAWTAKLREVFRAEFGPHTVAYPVFNGTGANVIALASCLKRHEGVIAVERAHIDVDEAGAPERLGGFKLLTVASPDQKLTPAQVRAKLGRRGDPHAVQPRVISIAQSTELGTVYSLAELRALGDLARAEGLYFHMDGARIANAAAALGCSLRECTVDVGVDVLSFGGTKNGLLGAEAVVGLSERYARAFAEDLPYGQKQGMQLASKMRFFSAQLLALFEGKLWHANAAHANAMAKLLADGIERLQSPEIEITQTVQANALFVRIPRRIVAPLQAKFPFYVWDDPDATSASVVVRWMTSFQTLEVDVAAFLAEIAQLVRG